MIRGSGGYNVFNRFCVHYVKTGIQITVNQLCDLNTALTFMLTMYYRYSFDTKNIYIKVGDVAEAIRENH